MNHFPDLSVTIAGIGMKNPVMTASGTFGYAKEFKEIVDLNRIGAIVVKGLSLEPSPGNPPPRIAETPCGMLNAIGLENVGIDAFVRDKLPFLKTLSAPVLVNIYGKTVGEYGELAARLQTCGGIAGIEVNISCPNVTCGGMAFGVDPAAVRQVVGTVRKNTSLPMVVKLSPNVSDITVIAQSAIDAGADALSLINTLAGMAVDVRTRKPRIANIIAGLSGPAIKPVALRMVWETARISTVPVIGIGGIMTAEDALEFLIVGASAVQVGTANFVNPTAVTEIIDGIGQFMIENNITCLSEIIGSLKLTDQSNRKKGEKKCSLKT
jgi:dihydroorotate dehydrogenase (NAD+) catalytic subunit